MSKNNEKTNTASGKGKVARKANMMTTMSIMQNDLVSLLFSVKTAGVDFQLPPMVDSMIRNSLVQLSNGLDEETGKKFDTAVMQSSMFGGKKKEGEKSGFDPMMMYAMQSMGGGDNAMNPYLMSQMMGGDSEMNPAMMAMMMGDGNIDPYTIMLLNKKDGKEMDFGTMMMLQNMAGGSGDNDNAMNPYLMSQMMNGDSDMDPAMMAMMMGGKMDPSMLYMMQNQNGGKMDIGTMMMLQNMGSGAGGDNAMNPYLMSQMMNGDSDMDPAMMAMMMGGKMDFTTMMLLQGQGGLFGGKKKAEGAKTGGAKKNWDDDQI